MTTETVIDKSLSSVLAEVTTAMVEATKEYGPEAVDLALLVYRLDAAASLLLATVVVVSAIIFMLTFFKSLAKHFPDGEEPTLAAHFAVGVIGVPFFGIGGLSYLDDVLNVFYWAALFGYPEVMVAYKALVAAGMM